MLLFLISFLYVFWATWAGVGIWRLEGKDGGWLGHSLCDRIE